MRVLNVDCIVQNGNMHNAKCDYENGTVHYDMFRMLNAIMRNGNNNAKCHNEEWDCANGNVNYGPDLPP